MNHGRTRLAALIASVAVAIGSIGVAQASRGADDPPGHKAHHGKGDDGRKGGGGPHGAEGVPEDGKVRVRNSLGGK